MLEGLYLLERGDSEVVITQEGRRVLKEAKAYHATVEKPSARLA